MADRGDARERLFKCRRLLLGTSVALLAHYALKINIQADAEAMGLKFEFTDIKKFWFGLWCLWAWALVTYTQYCHELGLDDVPVDIQFKARDTVLRWFVKRHYIRKAKKEGFQGEWIMPTKVEVSEMKMELGANPDYGPNSFHVQITYGKNRSVGFPEEKKYPEGVRRMVVKTWEWIVVLTASRFGTDYFAPFIVAGAAVVFWAIDLFRVVRL